MASRSRSRSTTWRSVSGSRSSGGSRSRSATARWVSMIEVWRWAEKDPLDLYAEYQRPRGKGLGAPLRRLRPAGEAEAGRGPNLAERRSGSRSSRCARTDRVMLPVLWRLGERVPADALVRARAAGRQRQRCRRGLRSPTSSSGCLASTWPRAACTRRGKNAFITISGERELLERAARVVERVVRSTRHHGAGRVRIGLRRSSSTPSCSCGSGTSSASTATASGSRAGSSACRWAG